MRQGPKEIDDLGVASHYPVLALAIARTEGPVLELGTGKWSTSLLHTMCVGLNRQLVSLETDREWVSWGLKNYQHPLHEFHWVENEKWDDQIELLQSRKWDVAFVDHNPGDHRYIEIERLANNVKFILAHDSENAPGSDYRYEPVFDTFKYRTDYDLYRPWTTIVSNFEEFPLGY